MDDLVPLLKKRAAGRNISGLNASRIMTSPQIMATDSKPTLTPKLRFPETQGWARMDNRNPWLVGFS